MSAWEALMWRAEGDPRTRSTGILLEILDHAPAPAAFTAVHERAVRRIPRLRDRVVEPIVPVTEPHWSPDPVFDLTRHVRTVTLPDGSSESDLLAYAEQVFASTFDVAHPPWEAILVDGLPEGRAAYLLKVHHSMSDGLGLVQLLDVAQSAHPDEDLADVGPDAAGADHAAGHYSSVGLVGTTVANVVRDAPRQALGLPGRATRWGRQVAANPRGLTDYLLSAKRLLTPPEADRSELLAGRGTGNGLLFLDIPFADVRRGAKAVGGSVNDGFIAAMLGGLRLYHERHGVLPPATLPVGLPVSLRAANDPMGGNNFTGAQIVAPLGEPDAAERIRIIREMVLTVRDEPALGVVGDLSTVLARLPTPALVGIAATFTTTSDLQVSNIRGLTRTTYLAGAEVLGMYPLGPRPGVAVMAALITYRDTCCLGLNVDPEVFTDIDELRACLRAGFDEVIALADEVLADKVLADTTPEGDS
ncbi:wax ester/triacylglycerol synthase domain-containing protein [Nocardioides sp. WS12]|uniref:wax ester/triacylglycerol synthase domain-containing protein n=1 Tax=Nocardioides sp. WS12 TaxID=2486272 RepID=UPI0015FBA5B9|nr:wax ester/triacylglycerol synthase domain-containing protein [Nocardioides sp. WS12]